jgi:hypothetical protein
MCGGIPSLSHAFMAWCLVKHKMFSWYFMVENLVIPILMHFFHEEHKLTHNGKVMLTHSHFISKTTEHILMKFGVCGDSC